VDKNQDLPSAVAGWIAVGARLFAMPGTRRICRIRGKIKKNNKKGNAN
jgi:hypothetical protein